MQELYEHVTGEGVEVVEEQRQQMVKGEGWGLEFFITVALRCRRALNMLSAGERVHGGEG